MQHPEYNSTLILRSETISESEGTSCLRDNIPDFKDFTPKWSIHRRLLPRRPGRDESIDQHCTLYAAEGAPPSVLVLTPIVEPGEPFPYYHPQVSHLIFRYIDTPHRFRHLDTPQPALQIEAVPLPDTPLDRDMGSRFWRTCVSLLQSLHRYGWGALVQYKKRVIHDCLVTREAYQDLYLVMRERHKHLVDEWHEVTDPLKHVFEVRDDLSDNILRANRHKGYWYRNIPDTTLERHVRARTSRCATDRGSPGGGALEALATATGRLC